MTKLGVGDIIAIIFTLICVGLCIYGHFVCKKQAEMINDLTEQVEYYKNAANPSGEVIDSLKYNIQYRDTTIVNIKKKYVEDVEIIKNMPDSAAVNLFHELVWAN